MTTTDQLLAWQKIYASRENGAQLNEEQKKNIQYATIRATEIGIDPNIVLGIMYRESRFGNDKRKGKAGEHGVTQITPALAKDYGLDADRLHKDPLYAIDSTIEVLRRDAVNKKWSTPMEAGIRWNGGNKDSKNAYAQNYGADVANLVASARTGGSNIVNLPQEQAAQQSAELSPEVIAQKQVAEYTKMLQDQRDGIAQKKPVQSAATAIADAVGSKVSNLAPDPLADLNMVLSQMWDKATPKVNVVGAQDYNKMINVETA